MMGHDPLAGRYLDKVFPESRTVTGRDLERMGIDPALHDQAQEIVEEYRQTHGGLTPTVDQVVSEFRRRESAMRRRGI